MKTWPNSEGACFRALQHWPFKLLQNVISHAPNFAESLGSDCFCNLHPAGFPIGFGLHTALGGWLPALLISFFSPEAFLKVTEVRPLLPCD